VQTQMRIAKQRTKSTTAVFHPCGLEKRAVAFLIAELLNVW
jgi:hypothetical protein